MKVISGAQTGADRAALEAAKACGLETGGWMPQDYRAQDGNHPEFAELYNIQEHKDWRYPGRTRQNVEDADATIRFASKWSSPGEKLTLRYIKTFSKPHLDIDITKPPSPTMVVNWIESQNIKVLNVAGNAEKTSPGIQAFVRDYLECVFGFLSK
jgi:hypothetical protein